ncbi:nucleotide-binding-oligomerization-domain like receptor [Pyrrhoderma noxium]|uniref:Nucleotide-binding-oligomerization-domain like receptor n=1 Tax=Pyrrhoderma noxium TaxID=2282107 RepID=A0A286U5N2_9AGAM|nr:nucleotide-binding-oligomerization-domain like receptor [Pyrrhoderma noxium]
MPWTQEGSFSSANIELKDVLKPLTVTDQEANRPKCLRGTRVDLLQQIRIWAQRADSPNVFLLTGGAGTGKSTVARTIAEEFQAQKSLGCYIFFERGKTDSMSITNTVIKTIAYHLACHNSAIAELLSNVIKDDHELSFPSTNILFDRLLHDPLHSVSNSHESEPILVVLDALDECGSTHDQEKLAYLLKDNIPTLPSNFRFIVTSRPEEGVTPLLSYVSLQPRVCEHVKLNHLLDNNRKEVVYYVRHELERLRREKRIIVKGSWEWDENIDKLGDAAQGLFIWAATAINFVNGARAGRFDRLRRLVNDTRGIGMNLDMLYAAVLENCIDWEDDEMKEVFSSVFSLILFGKTPLSDTDIDEILDYEEGTTSDVLSGLHSLVAFEAGQPIRIHHTSLYDYLTSTRCDGSWFIDADVKKNKIVSRCFGLMRDQLRFNICGLETSFKFNRDVPDLEKRVDKRIHPGLLYACRYWAPHLQDVLYSDKLLSDLDDFAYNQLLYWLEVLSLTGALYECFELSLDKAIGWVKELVQVPNLILEQNKETHTPSELLSFLEDARHHLFEFIQPISESTPHLYMTFLPLKGSESDVARHYSRNMKEPTRIDYIGDKSTLDCITQINVGSDVFSISLFSYGDRVLSGSHSGVYVWDVDSGNLIRGPFGGDASVSFSYFGSSIIIVDRDGVVNEWDAYTGERTHGLPMSNVKNITSIAVEPLKYYATGSKDGAIQLWDLWERITVGDPLKGHSGEVLVLSFGDDGQHLASGSEDKSVIIWNVWKQKKKYAALKGHSGPVTSIAFTSSSQKLVSGSLDGTICLWKVSTGEKLLVFSDNGMGGIHSIASFEFEDRYILSGSEDGIIRLWDTEYREVPLKKFIGHTGKVICLSAAFEDRGRRFASGSSDGTIRVWDVERDHTIVDGDICAIAVSSDGEYLVSGSDNGTVSIWRIVTGEQVKVCYSPDGNKIVSGSDDETIRIWDASNATLLLILQGHTDWIYFVTYSYDGLHILSGSGDGTLRVWDAKNGKQIQEPIKEYGDDMRLICFSPDNAYFVSGSWDKTILNTSNSHQHLSMD